MHFKVRYYNKPHDLRLSNIRICPLAKGIWLTICELNLRGYDIICHGSEGLAGQEGSRYHSVSFGDDKDIRADLILYPDTPEEADLSLEVSSISKRTYYSIMVSSKCLSKKWDEYCKIKFSQKSKKSDSLTPEDYDYCPHCSGSFSFKKPSKKFICPWCKKDIRTSDRRS